LLVMLTGALAAALLAALRQRERVEAERAAARQLLESAIESMPDGFVIWDAEDRLVICNSLYREIYAISAPFIRPGVTFEEVIREGARRGQYPQAGPDLEGFITDLIARHRGDAPSLERLLPDGRWILVTERRTPGGAVVGIRTDITALKQANAELARAHDIAAAATAAKTRFLAQMSHELRTPLNGVLGLAQVLARDPGLSPEQREKARTLEKAGLHAVAVADDVLDLAKVESGQFVLRAEPVSLPGLLRDCATLMGSLAEAKAIRLAVTLGQALPAQVETDATRLRQVVLNLLSNAVKFTPSGGSVALQARLLAAPDSAGDPAMIRIEVSDSGPGIPLALREAIFGDFVQVGPGQRSGTGLGLAISAGLVRQMAGRIGCAANPASPDGQGALFWLELPMRPLAAPRAVAGAVAIAAALPPAPGSAPTPAPLAGALRILVADDVEANLAVARALLESAGHSVVCVNNGADAIAALEQATPTFDAVLMDVMMPGIDGLEAARRIRGLPGPARLVPMLAVTASAFAEDIAACRAAGMDAHLAKPIEREALLATLARLTGGRLTGARLTPAAPVQSTPGDPAVTPLLARQSGPLLVVPGLAPVAAAELAQEFLREIRDAMVALREAATAEAVVQAAHRLAGAAATLGAPRLTETARRLQATAPGLPEAERTARCAILAETCTATLAALDAQLPARVATA
jgi:signal transduction histidine kinase/DNA-binding NarL/FixJ family response regulator/HPt (histidine-containing phosphotransfer) domain-containing protein